MSLKLSDYDFEIFYKSGKKNQVADSLSRNPVEANTVFVLTRAQKAKHSSKQKSTYMPSEKIPNDMKLKIMNDERIKNKNKTASISNHYKKRRTSNGKTKNLNNNEKTLNI